MSGPGAPARAALAADVRRPITLAFLDIRDDPVRVTDAPYALSFANTGDPDLDGFTFSSVDPTVVSVGVVTNQAGGADTLRLSLSGLPGIDGETLNSIGNRANYQGRDVRLWKGMLDPEALTPIGTVWPYYTGVMMVPKIVGDRETQTIQLEVESYLAFLGQASNRTYLDQDQFDPGDRSAELAIAIANGASRRK